MECPAPTVQSIYQHAVLFRPAQRNGTAPGRRHSLTLHPFTQQPRVCVYGEIVHSSHCHHYEEMMPALTDLIVADAPPCRLHDGGLPSPGSDIVSLFSRHSDAVSVIEMIMARRLFDPALLSFSPRCCRDIWRRWRHSGRRRRMALFPASASKRYAPRRSLPDDDAFVTCRQFSRLIFFGNATREEDFHQPSLSLRQIHCRRDAPSAVPSYDVHDIVSCSMPTRVV